MIKDELREYAQSLGAELFGVASVKAFEKEFPDKASPELFVKGARSIIVVGLPYQPSTLATAQRESSRVKDIRFSDAHRLPRAGWVCEMK